MPNAETLRQNMLTTYAQPVRAWAAVPFVLSRSTAPRSSEIAPHAAWKSPRGLYMADHPSASTLRLQPQRPPRQQQEAGPEAGEREAALRDLAEVRPVRQQQLPIRVERPGVRRHQA